ncbi:MAG: Asp-tRNA(Asn)/Glu-tRNA(Gln) amidotransferase C subunit [Planctomycetota bacterium]|jgi:Asp-tRNA(Asn)/Glu-tRNA(Gln) amidotransferase C subunit
MAQTGWNKRVAKKFCGNCGESVTRKAKFCESCGTPLAKGGGDAPSQPNQPKAAKPVPQTLQIQPEEIDTTAGYLDEFESRESAQLSHEYFERHVEILSSYRKRLKAMAKELDRQEKHLASLAEKGFTEERTKELQSTLEHIENLGDQWEDLQNSYNQDSEVLDEEFQERFAEMEIDVELPEDIQTKMGRELDVMMRSFDRVGERINIVGILGNRLISQASGRWFGDESQAGGGRKTLAVAALVSGLLTFILMRFGHDLDISTSSSAGAAAFIIPLLFISRF